MVVELGRLVKEVEVKTVDINGEDRSVLNNTLAISISKDDTVFVDITAWGKIADTVGKYLRKGDEVLIEGELRNSQRDVEGKNITNTYILVKGFKFTYGNKREDK